MSLVTRTDTMKDTRVSDTARRAHCSRSTDCRCGQQLDLCVREHCPRCGRTLSR